MTKLKTVTKGLYLVTLYIDKCKLWRTTELNLDEMPRTLIMVLISALFAVALVPTIIAQWTGVNTSTWNFTGYAGAIILWGLAPFLLIAGIIISLVVGLIVWRKAGV